VKHLKSESLQGTSRHCALDVKVLLQILVGQKNILQMPSKTSPWHPSWGRQASLKLLASKVFLGTRNFA
jgi:hypothetical protein